MKDMGNKRHVAIYHSPCQDGVSAAWVFSKHMTEAALDFITVPGVYGSALDLFLEDGSKKNDIIYFLDYTIKRNDMIELSKQVKKIIIIDHHKSAQADLVDLPSNIEVLFDMNRCGSALTWLYFYPEIQVPQFLLYIEDYDLWTNKLVGTHEFYAWYTTRNPQTTIELGNLIADFPETTEAFLESRQYRHGQTVMQYRQILVDFILEKPIHTTLDGVEFVKFNSPFIQINSYVGMQAVAKYGKPCWIWSETGENEKVVVRNALRSNDDLPDVSEIAVKHGGGGHKNAAGFTGLIT